MKVRLSCTSCGQVTPLEPWQRLCWTCWRAERELQTSEDAYGRGFDAGYRLGAGERARAIMGTASPPNLLEHLGDLIRLCHPDRHPAERRDRATRVTAWLLEQRQQQ